MENVLNTVKSKVKTTKVLAILGVVLVLLGLFFNVGKLHFKVQKDKVKEEVKTQAEQYGVSFGSEQEKAVEEEIESLEKMVDSYAIEETSMNYWGGYVMLILGVLALALAYINFIESKIPEEARAKIKFWEKLKNIKLILVIGVIILVLLVCTWKMAINTSIAKDADVKMSEVDDQIEALEKLTGDLVKGKYSIGSGFVLIFLGAAALIAYPIFYKPEETVAEAQPAEGNVDPVANNE